MAHGKRGVNGLCKQGLGHAFLLRADFVSSFFSWAPIAFFGGGPRADGTCEVPTEAALRACGGSARRRRTSGSSCASGPHRSVLPESGEAAVDWFERNGFGDPILGISVFFQKGMVLAESCGGFLGVARNSGNLRLGQREAETLGWLPFPPEDLSQNEEVSNPDPQRCLFFLWFPFQDEQTRMPWLAPRPFSVWLAGSTGKKKEKRSNLDCLGEKRLKKVRSIKVETSWKDPAFIGEESIHTFSSDKVG